MNNYMTLYVHVYVFMTDVWRNTRIKLDFRLLRKTNNIFFFKSYQMIFDNFLFFHYKRNIFLEFVSASAFRSCFWLYTTLFIWFLSILPFKWSIDIGVKICKPPPPRFKRLILSGVANLDWTAKARWWRLAVYLSTSELTPNNNRRRTLNRKNNTLNTWDPK